MKERYFDNQRFKKIRWFEIGFLLSLLLSGFLLIISQEGKTEITGIMLVGLMLSMLGFGYTLPVFTEMFYIRKTGNKI